MKTSSAELLGQFFQTNSNLFILCSSILRIVHPSQFYEMITSQKALYTGESGRNPDHMRQVLESWPTIFNGLDIISNRETPAHRDVQGRSEWYDMLLTIGAYTDGRIEMPSLGLNLLYNPGTAVFLTGRVLLHGVPPVNGDRICVAQFVRDSVQCRLNKTAGQWMDVRQLERSCI